LKRFVKIRQALEVPPPDPSWLPAAGGSAPRPPPPCDQNVLSLSYYTATKCFKFVALCNEVFTGKILVKNFFWKTHYIGTFFWRTRFEHSGRFSPPPKLFFSPTFMIPPPKLFFFSYFYKKIG